MRYYYKTNAGTFFIIRQRKFYDVLFDDQSLGSYTTPQQALDDLCGGHTFWPASGIDPRTLGIPDDLSEWERSS